jgi:hypothetical protein
MTNESTQLNVLISGGFAGAYEQLLPEFQRMSDRLRCVAGIGPPNDCRAARPRCCCRRGDPLQRGPQ